MEDREFKLYKVYLVRYVHARDPQEAVDIVVDELDYSDSLAMRDNLEAEEVKQ